MELSWLAELEEKVRATTEELRRQRKENQRLSKKVEKLEGELAAAREGGEDEGRWSEERAEIRRRVEELASGLEVLLQEEG